MDVVPSPVERAGFMYRDIKPAGANGRTIVVLHGSGTDELTVVPLARDIDPQARIIAPRGRIDQNGERRWFLKHNPTSFDQASIVAEAKAFAAFLSDLDPDPARTTFLGYSNGGNLVHATALLHPGIIMQAALLRVMPVLIDPPRTDLSGTRILLVRGRDDTTYAPYAVPLLRQLRGLGAKATTRIVPAGHLFGPEDAALVRRWSRV